MSHHWGVAQLAERPAVNRKVAGSTPAAPVTNGRPSLAHATVAHSSFLNISSACADGDTMTATSPSSTIAFLGLGHMGRPMARNLVDAGFGVRTWNRSGGAVEGAKECSTIAQAVQ